jgi:DNA-binding CsgD family transcriptional regulator
VGREALQGQLWHAISCSGGAVLSGDLGVGKSHLLRWAGDYASHAGWHVERVYAGTDFLAMPFGAFAHLLPAIPSSPPVDLMSGLLAHLKQLSTDGHRLLLLADDTPALDPMSAAVLGRAVVLGIASVVLTARTGEALASTLGDLIAARNIDVLAVEPLTRPDFARLVEVITGQSLNDRVSDRLWSATKGNPLFVTELITDAMQRLGPRGLEGICDEVLPVSVGAAIVLRLGRLPTADRAQLELVAVTGECSLSTLGDGAHSDAIARLEEQRLIVLALDGRRMNARVAHPLVAESVVSALGFSRRRQRALLVADHIEQCGMRRGDDPLRVAIARHAAGAAIEVAVSTRAAELALGLGAMDTAEMFARRAFADEPSVHRGVLASYAAMYGSRPVAADDLLKSLEPLIDGDEQRALVASAQALNAMHGLVDLERARSVIDFHAGRMAGSAWRHELSAARIGVDLYQGRISMAVSSLYEILDDDNAPLRARLVAVAAGLIPLYLAGRVDEAVALGRAFQADFDRFDGGAPTLRLQIELELVEALAWQGAMGDAQELLARLAVGVTGDGADLPARTIVSLVTALVDALRGQHQVQASNIRALGSLSHSAYAPWVPYVFARLASVAFRFGDTEAGVEALHESRRSALEGFTLGDRVTERASAELAVLERDLVKATHGFTTCAERALRDGNLAEAFLASLRLVALRGSDMDYAMCDAIAGRIEGRLAANVLCCLAELRLGNIATALLSLGEIATAGYRPIAQDLADTFLRVAPDDRYAVLAALNEVPSAEQPVALSDGARIRPVLQSRTTLTRREAEVARLVAEGCTDLTISIRLDTSVRTVNAHLRSIFTKLGVNHRGEVADRL